MTKCSKKYQIKSGANVVLENSSFLVVNPLTFESSRYYGKRNNLGRLDESNITKFNNNDTYGKIFYVIDNNKNIEDPEYKVSIRRNFDGNLHFYNGLNEEINGGWIFKNRNYDLIMDSIESYVKDIKNLDEGYNDFNYSKKLLNENITQLEYEAEERRFNREWELGGNTSEQGIEAYAVLEYLKDNEGVEVLDDDEIDEIASLRSRLEELEEQPNSEEEIEEIEDKLMYLTNNKIDVYNIVPVGSHYNMTSFIVVNAGLDGNTYIAGNEDKTKDSAVESVKQLIDDIGIKGFSPSFYENYIDMNHFRRFLRDWYYDDVYNYPEGYIDESQREISSAQEEEILILQRKIDRIRNQIGYYNNLKETYDFSNDTLDKINNTIGELDSDIDDYIDEINTIESNPEGDYPEDKIEEAIDRQVDDRIDDPISFIDEYGLDISEFIDIDEFAEGVVESDGYGHTLSTYDGNMEEYRIEGDFIFVCRID
jgi:hypothetical protein